MALFRVLLSQDLTVWPFVCDSLSQLLESLGWQVNHCAWLTLFIVKCTTTVKIHRTTVPILSIVRLRFGAMKCMHSIVHTSPGPVSELPGSQMVNFHPQITSLVPFSLDLRALHPPCWLCRLTDSKHHT